MRRRRVSVARGTTTHLYVVLVNLLLFLLVLDTFREASIHYYLRSYRWYVVAVFTLATFVLLAHLLALGVAVGLRGLARAVTTLVPGAQRLARWRPVETFVVLAFLYVNALYFEYFLRGIPAAGAPRPPWGPKLSSTILSVVGLVLIGLYGARRHAVHEALARRIDGLNTVARVSLGAAVLVSLAGVGYKIYEKAGSAPVGSAFLGTRPLHPFQQGKPNVFLLTYDSVSPLHMSLYGYHRKTTPFLDELANRCVVFNRMYTNADGTPHALPSLLFSKYPPTHQVVWKGYVNERDQRENLFRIFQERGYKVTVRSPGFVQQDARGDSQEPFAGLKLEPGPPRGALGRLLGLIDGRLEAVGTGWSRSFREFHLWPIRRVAKVAGVVVSPPIRQLAGSGISGHFGADRPGRPIVQDPMERDFSLEFFRRAAAVSDRPVFVWFHGQGAHGGSEIPKTYREHFFSSLGERGKGCRADAAKRREKACRQAVYDGAIRYVDAGLEQTFAVLQEMGALDNAMVIIAADTGGGIGPAGDYPYEGFLRIPLLICSPQLPQEVRVDTLAEGVDLLPTITDLLGLGVPIWAQGESLVPYIFGQREHTARPKFVFISHPSYRIAIIKDGYRAIYDLKSTEVSLYKVFQWRAEALDVGKPENLEIARHLVRLIKARFGQVRW